MFVYKREAHYYETDQMKIIHHSNYVRWMEEARVAFMNELEYGYARMEEEGIVSPVLGIEVQYKKMVRFGDQVEIRVRIVEYNGVKLKLGYEIYGPDGTLYTDAYSSHCFLDGDKLTSLKKRLPELHDKMMKLLEEDK